MNTYMIHTESGSVYRLDTSKKTMKRVPDPATGEKLLRDGEEIPYTHLLDEVTIDNPLRLVWEHEGAQKIRSTTPMVSIERL